MTQIVDLVTVLNMLADEDKGVGLSVPEDSEILEVAHGNAADLWTCQPVDVTFFDSATTEDDCTIIVVLRPEGKHFMHILGQDGEYRRRVG